VAVAEEKVHKSNKNKGKTAFKKMTLHATKGRAKRAQYAANSDPATEMCNAILSYMYPDQNLGTADPGVMVSVQLRACLCLWSKAQMVSSFSKGMFELYQAGFEAAEAEKVTEAAKKALKGLRKAYKTSEESDGINMIGKASIDRAATSVKLCFGMGTDQADVGYTGCDALLDKCHFATCYTEKGSSSIYMQSPVGASSQSTFSKCLNSCKPDPKNPCPVQSRCSTALYSSCNCAFEIFGADKDLCKRGFLGMGPSPTYDAELDPRKPNA